VQENILNERVYTIKYAIYGALFGCCFPVIAYFLLDRPMLLFAIICTAPFFLGLFAAIIGRKQDEIQFDYKKSQFNYESAQHLSHEIIKNSPASMFCKDYSSGVGQFIEWNAAAENLFGLKKDEVVGKSDYDFFPVEQADFFKEKDLEVLNSNQPLLIPIEELDSPTKGKVTLRTWKVPVKYKDHDKERVYLLGISMDITQQLKVEQELRRAKDLAEETTKTKSRFMANMSHEIRTPMNAILTANEILKESLKESENRELIELIADSGNSLLSIINDILEFSKIESGTYKLENNDFDLKKTVEDIFNLFHLKAQRNRKNIHLEIAPEFPHWVHSDGLRIKQVLINLVGNAIKFSNKKINVRCEYIAGENEAISFKVEDDGIGIDEKYYDKLFKEFSQVDSSSTRNFGGTGLGLAISKSIVDLFNGKIWVESEFGKGSTFFVEIPIKTIAKKSSSKSSKGSVFDKNWADLFPIEILLAEDNEMNQVVIKKVFEKLGFSISLANDGQEALEMIKEHEYDLIFMDQHMPKMDGVDATKKIRELGNHDVNIYALTASVFNEDRERCLNAGMNGFLTKPVKIHELKDVIKETYIKIQQKISQNKVS
jgi:PAS domain S-box-containing protein